MKDIFLCYFFSSLLPQLTNSYSRKPKDKKTLALECKKKQCQPLLAITEEGELI